MSNIAESAVPYAILALYDAKIDITEANLSKLLAAAGIEVEPIWLTVFCRSMTAETVKSLLSSFEAGASAAAPVAAASAAPAAGKAAAAAPAAKKEEPEEEEEMSLSLFD
jgi:large subunit ribosomal protein LP1